MVNYGRTIPTITMVVHTTKNTQRELAEGAIMNNIKRLYALIERNIATINATLPYDRVTDAIIKLCEAIQETDTDESTWCIGECGYLGGLDNLIVGAYWHYTEWHGGQTSKSYQALCALGGLFSPGRTSLDEEDPSFDTFNYLNILANEYYIQRKSQL
jgi:hypothetical protein